MANNCEPINVSKLHSLGTIVTLKAIFVNNSTNTFFSHDFLSYQRNKLHFNKAVEMKRASIYCAV